MTYNRRKQADCWRALSLLGDAKAVREDTVLPAGLFDTLFCRFEAAGAVRVEHEPLVCAIPTMRIRWRPLESCQNMP